MVKHISWMHPSYRDLIIDELGTDTELRTQFLEIMSASGVKLALSDTGGKDGTRRLPLMKDDKSWAMLSKRCKQISEGPNSDEDKELLTVLTNAVQAADTEDESRRLRTILLEVCDCLHHKWDSTEAVLSSTILSSYCKASELLRPLPPLPSLEETWVTSYEEFQDVLDRKTPEPWEVEQVLRPWIDLLCVIRINEPRFLRQIGFPHNYGVEVHKLIGLVTNMLRVNFSGLPLEELRNLIDELSELKRSLEIMRTLGAEWGNKVSMLEKKVAAYIGQLEDRAEDLDKSDDTDDPDDDYPYESRSDGDEFDIRGLFSDL